MSKRPNVWTIEGPAREFDVYLFEAADDGGPSDLCRRYLQDWVDEAYDCLESGEVATFKVGWRKATDEDLEVLARADR